MLRTLLMGLLGLVASIGWLFCSMTLASASGNVDLNSALQATPQGIPVKDYFDLTKSASSKAKVVSSANPATKQTEVVQITNGPQQAAAVWSKPQRRFDLNQNQTLSMWLYFGNEAEKAADGMAFVIHNDLRKEQAMTQFPSKRNIPGETLGVWGVDNHNQELRTKKMVKQVAATAIQRSWALEFDTYLNTDHRMKGIKPANSFDLVRNKPLIGPHLAANYPGEVSSYEPHIALNALYYFRYVSLKHQGLIQAGKGNYNFLANAQWHHVTLNYETGGPSSQTGLMTYSFDDRDPVTGITNREGAVATFKIDKNKVDPEKTGKAYWGFTGAAGQKGENNLVVFDQVPGLVTSQATATVTDAKNHEIKSGGVVHHGEQVRLTYKLAYLQGDLNWQNISAQISLPDELAFDTVSIRNADHSEDTGVSNWTAGTSAFKHQLTSPLGKDNKWVTITFTGTAKGEKGVVHPTTSSFTSAEAAVESTTPELSIGDPLLILKLDTSLDDSVDNTKPMSLNGQVTFRESHYANSQLRLVSKLNGVKQRDQQLSDKDRAGAFHYVLKENVLHSGQNFLDLTVVTNDGLASNRLRVVLVPQEIDDEEPGTLAFQTLSQQLQFKGQLTGQPQELFRQAGFQLKILDERPHGTWSLQVMAEPLLELTTQQPLAGQLVYRMSSTDFPLDSTEAQMIANHENDGKASAVDVTSDWQHTKKVDRGLFLKLASGATAGNYQGKITWILSDAM